MKVINLSKKVVDWKIKGDIGGDNNRPKSELHVKCRKLIQTLFPTIQFKEEVPIPLRDGEILFFDFYIPMYKMAIEVHGQQHYTFSLHYHQTRANFLKHKKRDSDKVEWCRINNIKFVELPYNEGTDEWTRRIQRARIGKDE